MFVDQELSEWAREKREAEAKTATWQAELARTKGRISPRLGAAAPASRSPPRDHIAAAAEGQLQPDAALIRAQFRSNGDTELVRNDKLDEALEAAREARQAEEDAAHADCLNGYDPQPEGWPMRWAVFKLTVAVLVLFPVRLALLLVAITLMAVVCTLVSLVGCATCRCCRRSSGGALSVRPKNFVQRQLLRLLSPLCRLALFALGYWYIRERRVENDGVTKRMPLRCCRSGRQQRRWCRPSRRAQAAAAGAQATATTSAGRSGGKFHAAASTSTQRPGAATDVDHRQRIDAVSAAHGSTIIANHSNMADVLYVGWRYPATSVASDFFKIIPCFWVIANAVGVLFISGHSKSGGGAGMGATDRIGAYQSAAAVRKNHNLRRLLVFPEGTTTNGRQVLQLRTGAFVAGLPVQPVLFKYPWKHRNPMFTSGFFSTGWRMMTSWFNWMEVLELPVHYPTPLEQGDPRVFADNLQLVFSSCLDVPAVATTNRDVLRAWKRFGGSRKQEAAPAAVKRSQVAPEPVSQASGP